MTETTEPKSSSWLSRLPRWLVVALAIPLIGLDGWVILQGLNYFDSIISALILATVLAFLLDFPVRFLQQRGIQRPSAVLIIFLLALTLIAALAITLVPLILLQLEELINHLPDWLDAGSRQLQAFQRWAVVRRLPVNLSGVIQRLEESAPEGIESFSLQLPNVVIGAAGGLVETVLVVALTLYLLLHGSAFWQSIFRWFPQPWGNQIQQSLRQNFQSYFVGQATVALIQGTTLSLAFFLIHLPLFLLFGITIGLLSLVPFFDIVGVLSVSLLTALNNVWLGLGVFFLCLVIDQIIDNAVSPRIMGKLVGLNPVWIILSLLLGAQILGVIGVILAIPLASTIQDIIEHVYPMATGPAAPSDLAAPPELAEKDAPQAVNLGVGSGS
ncbi:AI-2E family transporter [Leptolyngbya sp. NK1-12]|uniref:AI-2E family transporter n=1 Tax=Leptolyngbya sp. NK1-12 TaxID=2547451 RepID=A0AA97AQD4_9CYAN|nr:AI-2E family transporter [Leptolyngbya sp. NK1-12]WNZ23328.1 AI-2E family transporter [Leptolyngbya sp. NK1-12]